ncbi:MAG: preprotein translocase subunit SecA [Patescibacteria group bacterium]|jgi:preprotein translocase subunit SecA
MSIFGKILGDSNQRVVDRLKGQIEAINAFEPALQSLSDDELRAKTAEFRQKLVNGAKLDDITAEAFAVVRETGRRRLKMRHFDSQLVGGLVLHQGKISEMKTGEGKTLVATLPLYLNALSGQGAHLVTVNDYLAGRDAVWMGAVYHALGMSTASIQHESAYIYDPEYKPDEENGRFLRPVSRAEAYRADITYGTNNEFGFDYLRDNMVYRQGDKVQRPLHYAIVDEVDSILIDEARTPLIISAPAEESNELYKKFAQLVPRLLIDEDYNVDEKMRAATLTEAGISKMEKWLGIENLYVEGGIDTVHHLEEALKAHALFRRDKDYVVKDGEVIIVDEFTGRLMHGRRYSEGLHQAIEAKEGVDIKQESRTMATITFQNYFRLYEKLAGMTGTAATEAEEFSKIYNLDVVIIPTNKPMVRKDHNDVIYKNEEAKFQAVVKEIKECHEAGQPVLVGTISIEKNELLGELLEREGVPHQMLNAKNHEKEAKIIAQAGQPGAVTIATNMAGRGVDIVLGGNPFNQDTANQVKELGGLYVIGTERHESRRIDNQLRGRSGRQGDPGMSRFFVSLDDDLMRVFGSDRVKGIMERFGLPDDMPIENRMISKSIESAQKKVEGHNFDIRKQLVEYDDVMNKHREVVYKKRNETLAAADHEGALKEKVLAMVNDEIEQIVLFHTPEQAQPDWNIKEICETLNTIFPLPSGAKANLDQIIGTAKNKLNEAVLRTDIINYCNDLAFEAYRNLEREVGEPLLMRELTKSVILRSIDTLWVEHLEQMDYLRRGIGLRGYGQRDPLVEYKKEGYGMFTQLMSSIESQVVYNIYKIGQAKQMAYQQVQRQMIESGPSKVAQTGAGQFQQIQAEGEPENNAATNDATIAQPGPIEGTIIQGGVLKSANGEKIGRNDPCPCGATHADGRPKKFKHCHGK